MLTEVFFIPGLNVSLQTFHEAAIFLQMIPRELLPKTREPKPFHALTLTMLRLASDLGHDASTLTYLDFELELHLLTSRTPTLPADLRARLDALADTDRSPDAHTLSARIAAHDGGDENTSVATLLADRAIKLAEADPTLPNQWGAAALVLLGQLEQRRGEHGRAMDFFRAAAVRYNSESAWLELAFDGECPPEMARVPSAMLGNVEDALKISEALNEHSLKMLEKGDKRRFADCQFMAEEWLKLARLKKEDVAAMAQG